MCLEAGIEEATHAVIQRQSERVLWRRREVETCKEKEDKEEEE